MIIMDGVDGDAVVPCANQTITYSYCNKMGFPRALARDDTLPFRCHPIRYLDWWSIGDEHDGVGDGFGAYVLDSFCIHWSPNYCCR